MAAEIIAHLYEEMCDELKGAEDYAKLAQMWKSVNGEFAKNFISMANDELKHAAMIRDMANHEMERVMSEHADPIFAKEYMKYFGEKFIDKHAKVRQIMAAMSG